MEKDNILESKFNQLVSDGISYILSSLLINSTNDTQREVISRWVKHPKFELDLRNEIQDKVTGVLNEYKEELNLVSLGKKSGKYFSERLILGFKKESNG